MHYCDTIAICRKLKKKVCVSEHQIMDNVERNLDQTKTGNLSIWFTPEVQMNKFPNHPTKCAVAKLFFPNSIMYIHITQACI